MYIYVHLKNNILNFKKLQLEQLTQSDFCIQADWKSLICETVILGEI